MRRFPARKLEDAKAWAGAADDHPGRFEPIEGLPRDVVAIRAVGVITAQDYRDMLVPLVEEKLKEHDKLKCLFVLGDDFDTYSARRARGTDAKFGIDLLRDFTRVAVVTDVAWMTRALRPVRAADALRLQDLPDGGAGRGEGVDQAVGVATRTTNSSELGRTPVAS